jgi:hypothetical protein
MDGSINGRLYVAIGSADQVAVFEAGRVAMTWSVGRISQLGACLRPARAGGRAEPRRRRLTLLDQAGQAVASPPVGTDPKGFWGRFSGRIIAGDSWWSWIAASAHVAHPGAVADRGPPVRMVLDTRRNALYAVAFNGIPAPMGAMSSRGWRSGCGQTHSRLHRAERGGFGL